MSRAERVRSVPEGLKQLVFDGYIQRWQMTEAERCTLIMLLEKIRPRCSIEIGTALGGSLSALSRFSEKVYALDIDPSCRAKLKGKFSNVEFIVGRSQETLPPLLKRLQTSNESPGCVLIDGDHTREAVKEDIECILQFRPTKPLYMIMHDSFNPECRRGIIEAKWDANPHVHFVELDFVPGEFYSHKDYYLQMWCGFALAVMLPTERTGDLEFSANAEFLFQTVLSHSIYNRKKRRFRLDTSRFQQQVQMFESI